MNARRRSRRVFLWSIPLLLLLLPLVAVLLTPTREWLLARGIQRAVSSVPGTLTVESAWWPSRGRVELRGVRWYAEAPGALIASIDCLRLDIDLGALRHRRVVADTLLMHMASFDLPALQRSLASLEKPEPRAPSGPLQVREIEARWIELRATRAAVNDSFAVDTLSIQGAFRMETGPRSMALRIEQGSGRFGTANVDSLSVSWSSAGALTLRASGRAGPEWPIRVVIEPLAADRAPGSPSAGLAKPLLVPSRSRVWLDRACIPARSRDWADSTAFAILDVSVPSPAGAETLLAKVAGRIEDVELETHLQHTPHDDQAWVSVQGSGLVFARRVAPEVKMPDALTTAIEARATRDSVGLAIQYIAAAAFRQGAMIVDRADVAGWFTLDSRTGEPEARLVTAVVVNALGLAATTHIDAHQRDGVAFAVDPIQVERVTEAPGAVSITSSRYAADSGWGVPARSRILASVRSGITAPLSTPGAEPGSVVVGTDKSVTIDGLEMLGDLGTMQLDGSLSGTGYADIEVHGAWDEFPALPSLDRMLGAARSEVAERWRQEGPFDAHVRASFSLADPLHTADATLEATLPGPRVLAPLWPSQATVIDSLGAMASLEIAAELITGVSAGDDAAGSRRRWDDRSGNSGGVIDVKASGEGWLDELLLRGSWSGTLNGSIAGLDRSGREAPPLPAPKEATGELLRTWVPSTLTAIQLDTLSVDLFGAALSASGSSGGVLARNGLFRSELLDMPADDGSASDARTNGHPGKESEFSMHVAIDEKSALIPVFAPPRLREMEAALDLRVVLESANDRLRVQGGGSFEGLGFVVPQVLVEADARLAGPLDRSLRLPNGAMVPFSDLEATLDLAEGFSMPAGSVKRLRFDADLAPFIRVTPMPEAALPRDIPDGPSADPPKAVGPSVREDAARGTGATGAAAATVRVVAEGMSLAALPPSISPARIDLTLSATAPESLMAEVEATGLELGSLSNTGVRMIARTGAKGIRVDVSAEPILHGTVQVPWHVSLDSLGVAQFGVTPHGDSLSASLHLERAPVPLGRDVSMSRYVFATGDVRVTGSLTDPRAHADVEFALPEEEDESAYRAQVEADLAPEGVVSTVEVAEDGKRVATASLDLPLAVSLRPWRLLFDPDSTLTARVDATDLALARFARLLPDDMTLDGTAQIHLEAEGPARDPRLDGRIKLESLDLALADGSKLRLGGVFETSGSARLPVVSGQIEVAQGTLVIPDNVTELHAASGDALLWGRSPADSTETEMVGPPVPAAPGGAFRPVMDVAVDIPNGLWIRGRNLQVELGGELRLDQSEMLHLSGTLRALRGQYRLLGRVLEVEQGEVRFYGEDDLDPALDLSMTTRVQGVLVRVSIFGTAKQPELVLSSEPPHEQGDILSYLVLGRPVEDLDEDQVGLVQQRATEIAALFGTMRVEGVLEHLFGFDLVSIRQGTGPDERSAFVVGKYLSPRILLKYEQGLSTDSGSFFNLEYLLTRYLRLESLAGPEQSGVELNWAMDY